MLTIQKEMLVMAKIVVACALLAGYASGETLDPAKYGPTLPLAKVEGSQGCTAVEVSGDYLYAAGSDHLAVYDIKTDPANPRQVALMRGIRGSRQIAIYKDRAYITARSNGLWIVDIGDPLNPKVIRQFDTIELATGIAASENVIFIAHRVYGVQLLDVSDPRFPKHISQVRTGEAQSVVYRDGMLYVGDWGAGKLTIVDVHDLRNPHIVAQGQLDGFGDGVFVKDNLCYCSTGHDAKSGPKEEREGNGRGVEVFDISDPTKPAKLGVFKFPQFLRRDNDYWTVRVCGTTAFCVDSHNGFYMVDASDPANLKGIGAARLPPPVYTWKIPEERKLPYDCCASLAMGDGVVYIAGLSTGIHVVKAPAAHKLPQPDLRFDIPPEEPETVDPRLWRYNLHCQVRRVAVTGDFAYVAASHSGLKLFRIGEGGLEELRTWERECVYDVAVHGETLFVAEGEPGLTAYRIAEDGDISKIGSGSVKADQAVQIVHIMKDGKYAAVSCGTGMAYVLDVTDPAAMKQVYRGWVGGILYGDMFPCRDKDGVFPINWHSRGIAWYSLNGEKPEEIKRMLPPNGSQMDGIDLTDNGLFIFPVRGRQLAFIDPASPERPNVVDVKSIPGNTWVRGIPTVDGNLAAFASRREGKVVMVDLSNPDSPTVVKERCYDLSAGNCDRVAFHKGKMIIPAGHYGLFMEK
jgi:hypothetical protein